MAVKDHSLDDKIIQAAKEEFLKLGFQKASLHKIAEKAGTTTGALYTRYTGKDDLFCSLVKGAFASIGEKAQSLKNLYADIQENAAPEKMLEAIHREEKIYVNLLFEYYDECVLFFCKSGGSSVETMIQQMMDMKAKQTIAYLKTIAKHPFREECVDLIMHEQFHIYRVVLEKGYDRETAGVCIEEMLLFLEAGWKYLFEKIMN